MNTGYQVTFFTQQDRTHSQQPLAQWLGAKAAELGLPGATLNGALEGLGHDGRVHSLNMYDFSDQPVQIVMILGEDEYERLMAALKEEGVTVFYTRTRVEYETLNG